MDVRGTQLLLGEAVSAAAAADRLATLVAVVTRAAHSVERTFWDTFDGRLHGSAVALVAAAGRLALVDSTTYAELVAQPHAGLARARRLLLADLSAGALRDRLAQIVEIRALTPIVRVRSRLAPIDVLDDVGKIVVRLRAEEPVVLAGGDARLALRARLHVTAVRGYDADYERLLALLQGELGLQTAPRALHDEAVAAIGGSVGGISSKVRVALEADERADAAAVAILRRLLEIIEANLPGTLDDVDSEFLHDLRVAVRRSRALQRELRGVFPPAPLRAFRAGFRELQALTGPTRDLDVQLLDLDGLVVGLPAGGATDVQPLRELLARRLAVERRAMVEGLRSARTRALLDGWAVLLDGLVASPEGDRPDGARPVVEVAGRRIGKVHRRMVKMGRAIDDCSPPEALHELRKQGKELRYLLEFFASLYEPDVVKPMVATLKDLQDVLGRFQDHEVQAAELRALGDEVAGLEGGAAALMAMGVVAERLDERQAQARAQFSTTFERFAAKHQRRLVKRTFG